ncbi:MAG: RNA ligase [Candidatus ainarchaeum sp.]|nr:RNA ligase [Candidatus ainarchaeum sp.]
MVDSETVRKAMEKGVAEKRKFESLEYVRFRGPFRAVERGSVIAEDGFFPGFPHIKRIFTLEKGLARNIEGDAVFAEEKIDGYNLRAIWSGGALYALSRGGIVDAFSTEKLREIVPKKAFRERVMLCGEMIGNTPYTKPAKNFDVKYFVFDIYDLEDGEFMPQDEKRAFIKANGLESVPQLGKFSKAADGKRLRELALNVNKARKEGIVFKSESREQVVKYVNPNADIEDVGNSIKQIFDMPTGHFNQRMLRSGIFVREYGLDQKAYGKEMGKAIYGKFCEGLRMLESEGEIYDEFEIRVKNPAVWDELKSHMGKEVKLRVVSQKQDGERTIIRFRKIYVKSTKKLREFLGGKGITD